MAMASLNGSRWLMAASGYLPGLINAIACRWSSSSFYCLPVFTLPSPVIYPTAFKEQSLLSSCPSSVNHCLSSESSSLHAPLPAP